MRGSLEWPANLDDLLERSSFLPLESAVNCAVSGGPDSMAMLALAVAAGCSAHAIYIDHGLRPGGDKEAAAVKAVAETLGATFESVSVAVAPGGDLEERGSTSPLCSTARGLHGGAHR